MKFNTKYRAQNIRTTFLVSSFLLVVLIVVSFLTDFLPVKNLHYFLLLAGVILYGYHMLKRYAYIEFSDEGEKIILRYFKLVPVAIDHHSIEIPKKQLIKVEVSNSHFGLRQELILFVKTKNGIMKYPAVSTSILDSAQRISLMNALQAIAKLNR